MPNKESQKVNREPKLARLHMGHLFGPNMAPWNDFCYIKNLKFTLPLQCPINRNRTLDQRYYKDTFSIINDSFKNVIFKKGFVTSRLQGRNILRCRIRITYNKRPFFSGWSQVCKFFAPLKTYLLPFFQLGKKILQNLYALLSRQIAS